MILSSKVTFNWIWSTQVESCFLSFLHVKHVFCCFLNVYFVVLSVTVDLVFVDANNKPIDSTDSSKILEDKSVLEELGKNGFTLSVEGAKALKPRPEESNGMYICQ